MGNINSDTVPQVLTNPYNWKGERVRPDARPKEGKGSQYDPLYGFPNGRKERVMIATPEEMRAFKLPLRQQDYCAHKLIEYMKCRYENFPLITRCDHDLHNYHKCEYEDQILRLKEYEREKRLMERDKRKKLMTQQEENDSFKEEQ